MRILLSLLLLVHTTTLFAQNSTITTYKLPSAINTPSRVTATEDRLYFVYDDGTHGAELWYIENTNDKPKLAIDHMPGSAPGVAVSNFTPDYNPAQLGVTGKFIYFIAFSDATQINLVLSRYSSTTNKVDYLAPCNRIMNFLTYKNKLYIYGGVYGHWGFSVHDPTSVTTDTIFTITSQDLQYHDIAEDNIYYTLQHNVGTGSAYVSLNAYDLNTKTHTLIARSDTGQYRIGPAFTRVNDSIYFTAIPQGDSIAYLYSYDRTNGIRQLTDKRSGKALATGAMINNHMVTFDDKLHLEYYDYDSSKIAVAYYDIKTQTADTVYDILETKTPTTAMEWRAYATYNDKLFVSSYYAVTAVAKDRKLCSYNPKTGKADVIDIKGGYGADDISNITPFKGALYMLGKRTLQHKEVIQYYEFPTSAHTLHNSLVAISAYPNPTNDNAQIDIQLPKADALTITLTDLMGRTLQEYHSEETSIKHSITIPMAQLPTGTYIYNISTDNGTQTAAGKLIKQ